MEIESLKTNLDKLKVGLLLRSLQKENDEPENIALDQISKELRFLQRQSEYVNEIERVLKELRLTKSLIEECGKTKEPQLGVNKQELLTYHQGVFLNLVHQMKDKITQLINLITEKIIPKKPAMENDISVANLINKKQKILEDIGIENEIQQWSQGNLTSKIAVALRKRTQHHHRVTGLTYDKDFLNLKFTDLASQPDFQKVLTDFGKQEIEKMRLKSTECLFSGALSKADETLKEIEDSIDRISNKLVNYFKLPITQENVVNILKEQDDMRSSFNIVNRCSIDKIPEPHKKILVLLIDKTIKIYKDKILAIYLIGSLGRNEYEEGYSDIEVYIIANHNEIAYMFSRDDDKFSVKVFTLKQFLSEECQKYRIIAKSDGVLMYGKNVLDEEKIPKAGLFLSLILNNDIVEIMDQELQWIKDNPDATSIQISRRSRKLAKHFIDFIYGVVMANKPQFTSNRAERVERIINVYPENKNVLDVLVQTSRHGVGDLESLKNMIVGFRPNAEMNLKLMQGVKEGIMKQK